MEIVSAMHRALAGKVGQERFAVWFGRGVRMEPCGTTLRIAAADTFRLDYLRRIFRADLIEAARIAGNLLEIKIEDIEFVVDPGAGVEPPPSSQRTAEPEALPTQDDTTYQISSTSPLLVSPAPSPPSASSTPS